MELRGGEAVISDIILRQLALGLQKIYGDLLDSIILYGSTARGTYADDSDVDAAILLYPGATKEMWEQRLDLVVDLKLACGKVLSVLCIDCENFQSGKVSPPSIRIFERKVLFYGRQLNGSIRASLQTGKRRTSDSRAAPAQ